MKTKSIFLLAISLSLFSFSTLQASPEKHKFVFKIKGLENSQCYLGCYFGDKSYVLDTAKTDAKGGCTFAGDTLLPGGIYFILLKNKKYFEFIVDKEEKFGMTTDTADFVKFMKVQGSPENELFYEYLKYAGTLYDNYDKISKKMKKGDDKSASSKQLDSINDIVKTYKENFIAKHPDFLISKVFKAAAPPDIPPTPTLPNGRKDSTFAFRYYKAHFFDNIDFSDNRMVRTPPMVFYDRLKEYLTRLTFQIPDSINVAADYLISKATKSPDMFKFLVYYITDTYANSNIMGMDAVFVHMVNKYYTPGKAFWVSASQLEKLREEAETLEPILIGKKAPEIVLPDTMNVMTDMQAIRARYTILYFWDYDCGVCQKETPKMIQWYDSAKGTGIQVYAVQTNTAEPKKWIDYIIKHHLDWLNVCDLFHISNVRNQYDVTSTPIIFILDENKNIIAKKIDVKDLNKILKHDMEINSGSK